MANYAAVADVTRTLVELLRSRIADRGDVLNVDPDQVVAATPDDAATDADVRLSLYLYRVGENPAMNNPVKRVDDDRRSDPPLSLDCYYLLTAYPGAGDDDPTTGTIQQQRVLGLATQVLYDEAVLEGEQLRGSFGEDERLTVSLESTSVDELTTLWSSVTEQPYQPSTTYHVSPVRIESREEESFERVDERRTSVSRRDAPGPLDPADPDPSEVTERDADEPR